MINTISPKEPLFLRLQQDDKLKVRITTYPLTEPAGTFLLLAQEIGDPNSAYRKGES